MIENKRFSKWTIIDTTMKIQSVIDRIIYSYEFGIVKFYRGDKINGLGRGSAESWTVNLGPEVKIHYPK